MNKQMKITAMLLTPAILLLSQQVAAEIPGIGRVSVPDGDPPDTHCVAATCTFNLTASAGHITLGDGNQLLAWGYGDGATMQYPGPTLIVNQGDLVTVKLTSTLPERASIVFPGQLGVTAAGGTTVGALLTSEAVPGGDPLAEGTVTYTFTASQPGTYIYQSGTHPELQIEMGLVGTLIVRPTGFDDDTNRTAYGAATSAYDREYLFFQTDMDRCAHEAQEQALSASPPDPATHSPPEVCTKVDPASFKATLWFLNGRNGPDTMLKAAVPWLPLQPYNALARMHPGERVLMRLVGAGRDLHPFHHHGNNAWVIARDGHLLESSPGASAGYPDFVGVNPDLAAATLPDQSISNFTIQTVPGNTYDAIFTWTGKGLNWDIYGPCTAGKPGHDTTHLMPHEATDSHCDPFPVVLPEQQSLAFGGMWSGSQYLESLEPLPPLQGGLNPGGGFSFMWHSHTERELTNDDIFPGGMMTMMIIEGPSVDIDEHGNID
jgi:manganese oxidase